MHTVRIIVTWDVWRSFSDKLMDKIGMYGSNFGHDRDGVKFDMPVFRLEEFPGLKKSVTVQSKDYA